MSFVVICTIVMALVTYLTRVIPVTLFQYKIKNKYIKSFLYYTPYAVLGAMTFPGILTSTSSTYSSIAGMIVAIILSYFERGLVTVATASVLTAFAFQYILM